MGQVATVIGDLFGELNVRLDMGKHSFFFNRNMLYNDLLERLKDFEQKLRKLFADLFWKLKG